jgi:hypothetical protein
VRAFVLSRTTWLMLERDDTSPATCEVASCDCTLTESPAWPATSTVPVGLVEADAPACTVCPACCVEVVEEE